MGIDIERVVGIDQRGEWPDVAGEWRGCAGERQRRIWSDGDVEIHLDQRDGCHGLGRLTRQRQRSRSSGSGGLSLRRLPTTKRHYERDIGNRGNEVGGIFILAKPARATSNDTVAGG